MNASREELRAWDEFRRHTIVCPQCNDWNQLMCPEGLRLEKVWGEADERCRRAAHLADEAAEADLANEVALPPEWLESIEQDRPWTPEL